MSAGRQLSHDGAAAGISPAGSLLLSLGFWGCVLGAMLLFGTVSLAPRLVERSQLERSYASRQSELLTLHGEVQQLQRVTEGLRQETGFVQSVARHELQQLPRRGHRIPVRDDLRFDPRTALPVPVDVAYVPPVYLPLLADLAASPRRQWQWCSLAAALLAFGFIFLHDHAGSRAVGRVLLVPLRQLSRRYRREE